jgi:hypothetical protein
MLWIALIAFYCFVALAFCIALGVAARKPVPCIGIETQQPDEQSNMNLTVKKRSSPIARVDTDDSCLLHDKYAGLNGDVALGGVPFLANPAAAEEAEPQENLPARTSPVVFIQQSQG